MPTGRVIDRYASDPVGFAAAGRRLGGTPGVYGDASVEVQALPRIPLICVLWRGDEEFPPRAGFLYDASAAEHLPLDMVLDLTNRVADRLVAAGGE